VLPKLIRVVNMVIAVACAAFLAAVGWTVWRPMPQVSGELRAPVTADARVARDGQGVPHVQAATLEDALFLQGFVTAQDRMFQMDGIRRLAGGELAEILGPSMLESDLLHRRLRMRRLAEMHTAQLPAADRALLSAYARGVNFYLESNRGRLPVEFTLLNYDPKPWSATDCLLVALMMHKDLTGLWEREMRKRGLLEAAKDPAKVEMLLPARTGWEPQPGSNAWALSGKWTASGKPMLANDPHLRFSSPSTWHLVHLRAPDLDVMGATLPGVPGVIVGHNEHIAWGVTNLHYDVIDFYEEKIDVRTGRYVFRGQAEQARLEQEVVLVKGHRAERISLWVTRHGPVFSLEGQKIFTLRWAAAEPNTFQFPILELNRARNFEQFRAALKRFPGPGQNFVYADREGNIGYQATGLLPIRKGGGDVPSDGAGGEQEWQGFIPFEELPTAYNPPSGLIVTGNQNPFPRDYRYPVTGDFAPHYRARQMRALLESRTGWKPAEMMAVQKDVYSAASHFLAQQTVQAVERRKATNPAFPPALDVLRAWNGQMEKGTAAPLLISLLYQHLRRAVVETVVPGKSELYQDQMSVAVLERLLRERPEGWVKDWDLALVDALDKAIREGREMQGGDVARWDYGYYNELTIEQPVLSRVPVLGKWFASRFNIGPVPMSGSSTTVKQTTRRLGPSMRFVADLANWDQSLLTLTIGQSAHVLSSHYRDHWPAYYGATGLPFRMAAPALEDTLLLKPR
jgi:penicillin amidase